MFKTYPYELYSARISNILRLVVGLFCVKKPKTNILEILSYGSIFQCCRYHNATCKDDRI